MPYINRKVQENALKCDSCRFNLVNDYNLKKRNDETVVKAASGAMWAACKMCTNRKDFEKVFGVDPLTYYSSLYS
jgi:transcription elongation factor Elf1